MQWKNFLYFRLDKIRVFRQLNDLDKRKTGTQFFRAEGVICIALLCCQGRARHLSILIWGSEYELKWSWGSCWARPLCWWRWWWWMWRCMNGRGWSREKVIPVNGSSLLLNTRATVPEESVLQLKGREKLLFITVAEVQLDFLTLCRVKIMLYLSQHLLITHYMVWQMETPTAPMVLW